MPRVLKLTHRTHWHRMGVLHPLCNALYTAPMHLSQAFLLISAVCPVYFTEFFLSSHPTTVISGSQVTVFGSNGPYKSNWTTQIPTWVCYINDSTDNIRSYPAPISSEYNWVLCFGDNLTDGLHTLSMTVTVTNQHTLWFDQIQYNPAPSVPLNESTLLVDSTDETITKSPAGAWQSLNSSNTQFYGITSFTRVTRASFEFTFSGS
jgi:hypothetical protein